MAPTRRERRAEEAFMADIEYFARLDDPRAVAERLAGARDRLVPSRSSDDA
jgi:hypothetical protein